MAVLREDLLVSVGFRSRHPPIEDHHQSTALSTNNDSTLMPSVFGLWHHGNVHSCIALCVAIVPIQTVHGHLAPLLVIVALEGDA
jgi:hypothetical protein